jgi:hypothetical protein
MIARWGVRIPSGFQQGDPSTDCARESWNHACRSLLSAPPRSRAGGLVLGAPGADRAGRGTSRGRRRRPSSADLPPRRASRRTRATPQTRHRRPEAGGPAAAGQPSSAARHGGSDRHPGWTPGYLSFPGTNYRVGNGWPGRSAESASSPVQCRFPATATSCACTRSDTTEPKSTAAARNQPPAEPPR